MIVSLIMGKSGNGSTMDKKIEQDKYYFIARIWMASVLEHYSFQDDWIICFLAQLN